jgi:ribosome-binding factor A
MARVKSLLLRTLSDIVRDELDDPRLELVCFSDLRLARDLTSAEVLVVAVGGPEQSARCVKALEAAKPLIWNRLRAETDLRAVPELRFSVDQGPQYESEIEALLRQIPRPADETGAAEVDGPPAAPAQEDTD